MTGAELIKRVQMMEGESEEVVLMLTVNGLMLFQPVKGVVEVKCACDDCEFAVGIMPDGFAERPTTIREEHEEDGD